MTATIKFKRVKTKCESKCDPIYCDKDQRTTLILDVGYAGSPIGILKMLEFTALIIAFGFLVDFQGHYSFPQTIYLLVSISVCMTYAAVFLFIYFTSIVRIIDFSWSYLAIFTDLCCGCSMLITSAVVADLTVRLYDETLNPNWCRKLLIFSSCSYLAVASAFGFLASVFFLFSAYFQYREYNDKYVAHKHYNEI